MNINTETLTKVARTPGLCTAEEIALADTFLREYIAYRDAYRETFGGDAPGLTLESQLDTLAYYKDKP